MAFLQWVGSRFFNKCSRASPIDFGLSFCSLLSSKAVRVLRRNGSGIARNYGLVASKFIADLYYFSALRNGQLVWCFSTTLERMNLYPVFYKFPILCRYKFFGVQSTTKVCPLFNRSADYALPE